MTHEYFALLGLAPGRYEPGQLARSFGDRRRHLLAELALPGKRQSAARRLDQLYRAYAALRNLACSDASHEPSQSPVTRATPADAPPPPHVSAHGLDTSSGRADTLRAYIADSLEEGLLRFSRRQEILSFARTLGISDFHTQLLIAEVQFGLPAPGLAPRLLDAQRPRRRSWPFFAATLLLASAFFLVLRNLLA